MNVEEILVKLQSEGLLKLQRITGDYYTCTCPFHGGGNEKKPSFGVLMKAQYRGGQTYPEGFCHCFACNYANDLPSMITDILKNKGISLSGLDWLAKNIPGFDPNGYEFDYLIPRDMMNVIDSKYAVDYMLRLQNQHKQQYVSEEELASYRFTVQYMYDRHLTDKAIAEYDIGFDPNFIPPGRKKPMPCITMPVRDQNMNTLFLCRRAIDTKFFNYPEDVQKPLYGFELIPKDCKSLCICESCLDAISIHIFGYHSVALMGVGNSYQIQQLRRSGIREFVLCLDGDDAGKKAAAKLKKQLQDVAIVWTVHIDPELKDANNCTKSDFDRFYAERD